MSTEIEYFIDDYAQELISGKAAYFIGAGISVDSSLPDWPGLIMPFAHKIGLKDLKEKDMPLIAQYVINEDAGNRGPFINAICRKLRKKFSPNVYHKAIAKTNIKTIWTTNYDNLLENSFDAGIVDVKFNDEAIARDVPEMQVEIIKIHGCIFNSHMNDIVVSQADYEDFFLNRPATVQRLKLDLLRKSFLFIGYGYRDPNIQNIITEARRLAGNSTRQHYMIIKHNDEGNRDFELWCLNLRRYGIRVVKIKHYKELVSILEKLSLKSRGKSIFITGSHSTKADKEAVHLSKALAKEKDFVLNDGQSSGLMRIASKNYVEMIILNKGDINKRLRFFPNPYAANSRFANDVELLPLLKKWRTPLFLSTYVMVAFDGGMGTKAEVEVALDMGCIVIPYFRDKKMETWGLIDNPVIVDRIFKYDSKYIDRVKKDVVGYKNVLDLIHKIVK